MEISDEMPNQIEMFEVSKKKQTNNNSKEKKNYHRTFMRSGLLVSVVKELRCDEMINAKCD